MQTIVIRLGKDNLDGPFTGIRSKDLAADGVKGAQGLRGCEAGFQLGETGLHELAPWRLRPAQARERDHHSV